MQTDDCKLLTGLLLLLALAKKTDLPPPLVWGKLCGCRKASWAGQYLPVISLRKERSCPCDYLSCHSSGIRNNHNLLTIDKFIAQESPVSPYVPSHACIPLHYISILGSQIFHFTRNNYLQLYLQVELVYRQWVSMSCLVRNNCFSNETFCGLLAPKERRGSSVRSIHCSLHHPTTEHPFLYEFLHLVGCSQIHSLFKLLWKTFWGHSHRLALCLSWNSSALVTFLCTLFFLLVHFSCLQEDSGGLIRWTYKA